MDKPLPPEDESPDPITARTPPCIAVGLILYGVGFLLLSNNQPDLGPFVVVAGILAMMWGFLG